MSKTHSESTKTHPVVAPDGKADTMMVTTATVITEGAEAGMARRTVTQDGEPRLILSDGRWLTAIGKGRYQDDAGAVFTSTDPDAP